MDEQPEVHRSEGGSAKYAIVGIVLLLGGGAAIWSMTRPAPTPPRPVATVAHDAALPPPPTPTIAPPIELPPDEPDAAVAPDASAATPRIRYVTRYIDACPGTLTDPGAVQRTAQANFGSLRACYERELRVNNQLQGRLTARLVISTTGHVQDVSVNTAMNSRPLVECVKASLRRLTVPPARGGCATYDVTYNFSPRN